MIVFDARHVENEYSGLGRYSAALLISLIEIDLTEKIVILLPKYKNNYLIEKIKLKSFSGGNIEIVETSIALYGFSHHFKIGYLPPVKSCRLFIYPHFDLPLSVRNKSVYIIHDTFVLDVPGYIREKIFLKKMYFFLYHNLLTIRKNKIGICVSENTKKDVLKHILRKNTNIHVALSGLTQFSKKVEKIDLPEKYILYVGDRRPHKNLKKMIEVFKLIKKTSSFDNVFFIIVGNTKDYGENLDSLIGMDVSIIEFSSVSDEQLNFLYKKSLALFFLTKYEGFGLPILEAWFWKRKIITSNIGASAEIAPEGSLLLDPYSPSDLLCLKISDYLESDTIVAKPDYDFFDWKRTAREVINIEKMVK